MPHYKTISDHFLSIFPGRIRKIAVNAGLGCPNRDGTTGRKGCAWCNNCSFNPGYSRGSITGQIEEGIRFSARKGPFYGYLAYFQAYTNTYGDTSSLIGLYEEALSYPGIRGLVLATRPDCLEPELLDYFERRFGNKAAAPRPYLLVELGVESTKDETLSLCGRGHDFACSCRAIKALDSIGIDVGAHLIIGLPGESEEDFILHAERISSLPVRTLKLHQLKIIDGTVLAEAYRQDPHFVEPLTPEHYAGIISRMLPRIRPDIALDRFVSEAPPEMVLAPRWGLKPDEFLSVLRKAIEDPRR